MLVDTHCHIHDGNYPLDADDVLVRAHEAGVAKMICVGTDAKSSHEAYQFAVGRDDVTFSIGIHPHETAQYVGEDGAEGNDVYLRSLASDISAAGHRKKLVAIGEIGLDYFYTHSPKDKQVRAFKDQIELALKLDLPIIFHVRDAFDDFWPIFDSYDGRIRGVLHSFTDSMENMQAAIERGLYIGVNGISTFTKDEAQKATFAAIPLDHLLVETDAPFLTPTPLRGKVNEPAFVKQVAEHHATIRGLSLETLSDATTANAHALFAI